MRKILLLNLLAFSFLKIYAQEKESALNLPVDSETGKITYTEIVQIDSASAKDLYSRAKYFIVNAFKNANAVNQLQDESSYTIVGKGTMHGRLGNSGQHDYGFIEFTITIICKDNRYKYSITNLVNNNYPYSGGNLEDEKPDCGTFYCPKKYWNQLKEYANDDIKVFAENLKKSMNTNVKSDW